MSPRWKVFSQLGFGSGVSSTPADTDAAGNPVISLSLLGTTATDPEAIAESFGCCCNKCLNDEYFPCDVIFRHIDENGCEDDDFELVVINPANGQEFPVGQFSLFNNGCCSGPAICGQTTVDVNVSLVPEMFGSDCLAQFKLQKIADNCCNTLSRLYYILQDGREIRGQTFGQAGYTASIDAKTFCPQNSSDTDGAPIP